MAVKKKRNSVRNGHLTNIKAKKSATVVKESGHGREGKLVSATSKRIRKNLIDGMKALERVGAVDKVTMKDFETKLLASPPDYSAEDIRNLRNSFNVSQPIFANLLNVPLSTLQKWEQGQKPPSSAALKLLDIVNRKGLEVLYGE